MFLKHARRARCCEITSTKGWKKRNNVITRVFRFRRKVRFPLTTFELFLISGHAFSVWEFELVCLEKKRNDTDALSWSFRRFHHSSFFFVLNLLPFRRNYPSCTSHFNSFCLRDIQFLKSRAVNLNFIYWGTFKGLEKGCFEVFWAFWWAPFLSRSLPTHPPLRLFSLWKSSDKKPVFSVSTRPTSVL